MLAMMALATVESGHVVAGRGGKAAPVTDCVVKHHAVGSGRFLPEQLVWAPETDAGRDGADYGVACFSSPLSLLVDVQRQHACGSRRRLQN